MLGDSGSNCRRFPFPAASWLALNFFNITCVVCCDIVKGQRRWYLLLLRVCQARHATFTIKNKLTRVSIAHTTLTVLFWNDVRTKQQIISIPKVLICHVFNLYDMRANHIPRLWHWREVVHRPKRHCHCDNSLTLWPDPINVLGKIGHAKITVTPTWLRRKLSK